MKKFFIILTILVLAGGSLYIYENKKPREFPTDEGLGTVIKNHQDKEKHILNKYSHPDNIYKFEYDKNLLIEEFDAIEYKQVTLKTPDYKISEGYPVLEEGAEINITVKKTDFIDIKMRFDQDSLAQKIAENLEETTISGVKAISYDYSYEGVNATIVSFIANGNQYSIRYRYFDEETKATYLTEFKQIINTFELIN